MTIINVFDQILASLNNFGLIGEFVKNLFNWIIRIIDNSNPIIIIILLFVLFFVIMFNNGIITKKSPHKRY